MRERGPKVGAKDADSLVKKSSKLVLGAKMSLEIGLSASRSTGRAKDVMEVSI